MRRVTPKEQFFTELGPPRVVEILEPDTTSASTSAEVDGMWYFVCTLTDKREAVIYTDKYVRSSPDSLIFVRQWGRRGNEDPYFYWLQEGISDE